MHKMKHTKVNEKFIEIDPGDNRNVLTIFFEELLNPKTVLKWYITSLDISDQKSCWLLITQ